MSQRSVEVCSLLADAILCLLILSVAYLPHQVNTVCYHNEYDAHILGKRQQ